MRSALPVHDCSRHDNDQHTWGRLQASQAAIQGAAASADARRLHGAVDEAAQCTAVLGRATDALSAVRTLRVRERELEFALGAADASATNDDSERSPAQQQLFETVSTELSDVRTRLRDAQGHAAHATAMALHSKAGNEASMRALEHCGTAQVRLITLKMLAEYCRTRGGPLYCVLAVCFVRICLASLGAGFAPSERSLLLAMQTQEAKAAQMRSVQVSKEAEAATAASRAAAATDTCARLRARGQCRDADAAAGTAGVLQARAEQAQREAMVAEADANLASDAAADAEAARRRASDEAELLWTAREMLQVAFDAAQDVSAPDDTLAQREAAAAAAQDEADSTAARFDALESAVKQAEGAFEAAQNDRALRGSVPALEAALNTQRRKVRPLCCPCGQLVHVAAISAQHNARGPPSERALQPVHASALCFASVLTSRRILSDAGSRARSWSWRGERRAVHALQRSTHRTLPSSPATRQGCASRTRPRWLALLQPWAAL